jgi:transposase InsO family protein
LFKEAEGPLFLKVIQPEIILSDHGSQFASPTWQKALAELGIQCKYSPLLHPENKPTERIMRELGKYFKIYCHKTHKKWPELVPYIENWLNSSVANLRDMLAEVAVALEVTATGSNDAVLNEVG